MFILNQTEAYDIVKNFFLSLVSDDNERKVNYTLETMAKDTNSGFLEIVFESLEALPEALKEQVPESFFKLYEARQNYCMADFSDRVSLDNFQAIVNKIIEDNKA